MQLETKITAKFVMAEEEITSPEVQRNLDAMNLHAEDCASRLQGAFQTLLIEMMDIKREYFTTKREPIPKNLGVDSDA